MNRVSAYTLRTHQQQSEIRASTSEGCIAIRAAEAELTAAPLPTSTAFGRLSLVSVWLSTLPPIDAAIICQSASPQSVGPIWVTDECGEYVVANYGFHDDRAWCLGSYVATALSVSPDLVTPDVTVGLELA